MPHKKERLAKQKDIQAVKHQSTIQFNSHFFSLIAKENGLRYTRIAVAVSKTVGKAVIRNRLRRKFKAIFSEIKKEIKLPVDVLLYPKKEAINQKWDEIRKKMGQGLGINK